MNQHDVAGCFSLYICYLALRKTQSPSVGGPGADVPPLPSMMSLCDYPNPV